MTDLSLQEQIPHNHCFGCGPFNEGGLNLKSYWSGSGPSIARFRPQPQHCSAPPHFVNGGIIATLLDCHSICTAMAAAYHREARAIGSAPLCYYATASLVVRYRRPAPMETELELEAEILDATDKGCLLQCSLSADGKLCADAEVQAVPVPLSWMGL
ncbi:MAG: PaaI family thioesterase [Gammaproteobacteria bacterium]